MFEDDELLPNENINVPFIIKMYKRICFRIEFYHKVHYKILILLEFITIFILLKLYI